MSRDLSTDGEGGRGGARLISTNRLADVFVEAADTLTDEFDLVDFLTILTLRAAEITGLTAVGLMLTDLRGDLHYMASSTEDARLMELLQLQNSEGPCIDCHRRGEPVACTDLTTADSRWPVFASAAVASGFSSVHAFPLRLRDRVIGALNMFGDSPNRIDDDSSRLVQALADVATIAILQERAIARADTLAEQLQYALNSRVIVEQAKGAISRALGISVVNAFDLLRNHARDHRRPLTEVAERIVNNPQAMTDLVRHGV